MTKDKRAPVPDCGHCGAPMGAYAIRCSYCETSLPDKLERERLERVLLALGGLFEHTHLGVGLDEVMGSIFGAGAGITLASALGGTGMDPLGAVALGILVAAAVASAVIWRHRVATRREQRRIYEVSLSPMIEAFLRERGVERARLIDVAKRCLAGKPLLRLLSESEGARMPHVA